MRKLFKWVLRGLVGLLGLAIVTLAIIYVYMGYRFDTKYGIEVDPVDVPTAAERIAQGERSARLRGCMDGCHGKGTSGQVFFEVPDGTKIVAPDLGRLAAEYSVPELERVIRHGVRPNGTSVLAIMPSSMFYGLSDEDLADILAFLRSRQAGNEALPATYVGPVVRAMLLYFSNTLDWEILSAAGIDHTAPRLDPHSEDPLVRGEYLARTVCSECHAEDLRGVPGDNVPSLAIVAAYSRDDFGELLKTGQPVGGRELDLMKEVAQKRFSRFTSNEVDDLHAFLQTLAVTD